MHWEEQEELGSSEGVSHGRVACPRNKKEKEVAKIPQTAEKGKL